MNAADSGELERVRLTMQAFTGNNQTRITQLAFNDGWKSAITHLTGVPHLPYKQMVLKQWLENDVRQAIKDPARIRQMEAMAKVAHDQGIPATEILQAIVADFVKSLVDGIPVIPELAGNAAAVQRVDIPQAVCTGRCGCMGDDPDCPVHGNYNGQG